MIIPMGQTDGRMDGRTDARLLHYAFQYGCCQHNKSNWSILYCQTPL